VQSIWKYEDKEVLLKEKEQKIQAKAKKEEESRLKKELELKKVSFHSVL
jgi:carbonic anhydrase